MTRKKFLTQFSSTALLAACSTSTFLQGCNTVKSIELLSVDGKIKVEKVLVDKDGAVIIKKFGTIPAPICLALKDDKAGYCAVLMLCTHKKCELRSSGYELTCPCHGSEFTLNGKVLSPPAQKDLQQLAVTHDSESIYIHLQ